MRDRLYNALLYIKSQAGDFTDLDLYVEARRVAAKGCTLVALVESGRYFKTFPSNETERDLIILAYDHSTKTLSCHTDSEVVNAYDWYLLIIGVVMKLGADHEKQVTFSETVTI